MLQKLSRIPLSVYMLGGLCFLNLGYFVLKNTQVLVSSNQRDFEIADAFIKKNIPKGSKVIGEPMYYYSVIKSGSDYQYMDLYNTLEERERILREEYQFEYMIVTDHISWRKHHIPQYFFSKSKFELLDSLVIPKSKTTQWLERSFLKKLVSSVEKDGYNCKIYKVKSE